MGEGEADQLQKCCTSGVLEAEFLLPMNLQNIKFEMNVYLCAH